jgi:hypothetical protein
MRIESITPDVADAWTYQEYILKAATVLIGAAEAARFTTHEWVREADDTDDDIAFSKTLEGAICFGIETNGIDPPRLPHIAQVFEIAARVLSEKYGMFREEQRQELLTEFRRTREEPPKRPTLRQV